MVVEIAQISLPYTRFATDWLPTYDVYYYVYCSIVTDFGTDTFMGFTFKRNCGYFTEAGLYAFFIVLALFVWLFVKTKKSKVELAILLVALLSTFSTTGLILTVLMFAYYINTRKIKGKAIRWLLALMTVGVVVFVVNDLLATKQEEHSFSFSARMFDLIGGIQLFLQSPIWGWGYKNHDAFYVISMQGFGTERSDSNGVVSALYQIGILGCTIFYVPFILVRKKLKENKRLFSFLSILLILLMMGEPIQYTTTGVAIVGFVTAMLMTKNKVDLKFE
ncbi:O-antigen ligase family protein [Prevotella sp. E15-22]|uniref:O-antigen ligase family protein n=1 Tax=Prevotella sp. E15-22 TaxID=2937774 RepID=UPI00206F4C81|nr:O-antigen ligase family protein [Prevotella sp. E15-22]UPS45264.1 O-antigen ligase family protein [Prevotella sp. E15-22]